MRLFILFILFYKLCFSYSNQYTYLVDSYDKEIDLEAKIISNIAKSSIRDEIKLYVPNISNNEKDIYLKFINLVDNCDDANFVFFKKDVEIDSFCKKNDNKLILTDDYKKLLNDNRYFGAFFWNKSRPNITFVKNRLENKKIKLSLDYEKFIEDF